MSKRSLLAALALVLSLVPIYAQNFPQHIGAVNDFAKILKPETISGLEAKLAAFEKETTIAVVAVTVPSLDGMSVDEYANRLFANWGIGQKGKDNGVLILLAPNERKVRIEVGYGLEGVLTDGATGNILDRYGVPNFRRNDWGAGIEQVSLGVVEHLRLKPNAPPQSTEVVTHRSPWPIYLFFGLVLLLIVTVIVFSLGSGESVTPPRSRNENRPIQPRPYVPTVATTRQRRKESEEERPRKRPSSSESDYGGGFDGGFGGFGGGRSGGGGSSRDF